MGTPESLTRPAAGPTREARRGPCREIEEVTMTQIQIERQLRQELHMIVMRLGHAGALQANEELSGELVDDAQVLELREGEQLSQARLAQRAKGLLLALQRLRAGTYGICDECGGPIATERLRALPSATTCLACQTRREEPSAYR